MTRLERQMVGVLKAFLKSERRVAVNSFRQYDVKTKTWRFDDAIWRRCDPYTWPLIVRARKAIAAAEKRG